jgi:hypothetical protein
MARIHKLDSVRHRDFLAERRLNAYTREPLRAGDEVVICANDSCGAAVSPGIWASKGNQCLSCHGTDTVAEISISRETTTFRPRAGRTVNTSVGNGFRVQTTSVESANSPRFGPAAFAVVAVVVVVVLALVFIVQQNAVESTRREQAAIAAAADEARRAEAIRVAERARVERGVVGDWHYSNGPSGQLATLTITRNGEAFRGEYPSHVGTQLLQGTLLPDGQLRLINVRQYGKFVRPGTLYEGDFGQEAWIQLGGDGSSLVARFSQAEGGHSVVMNRGAGHSREQSAGAPPVPEAGSPDVPLQDSTHTPTIAAATTTVTPDANRVVRVLSEPSGAQIYLGQRLLGSTPLDVTFPSNVARSRQVLSASRTGYERENMEFVPASLDSAEILIRLTIIPGQLRVLSSYDVGVVVNNQSFGPGTNVQATLPPGAYRVRLLAPDVLLDISRDITIKSGVALSLDAPKQVAVRIITRPANCEVSVDGRPFGSAPVTVNAIEGIHTFSFVWSSGSRLVKEINLQDGIGPIVITPQ